MPPLGLLSKNPPNDKRHKNKFLRMNYLAKGAKRKELKDSIQVVLHHDSLDASIAMLSKEDVKAGCGDAGVGGGCGDAGVGGRCGDVGNKRCVDGNKSGEDGTDKREDCLQDESLSLDSGKMDKSNFKKESFEVDNSKEDTFTPGNLSEKHNNSEVESGDKHASNRNVYVSKRPKLPPSVFTFDVPPSGLNEAHPSPSCPSSTSTITNNASVENTFATASKHSVASTDNVKTSSNVDETIYKDEEYVEDLAQLDVLLHYVNNLSASLEFLDWEKNKRKSNTKIHIRDIKYIIKIPCINIFNNSITID